MKEFTGGCLCRAVRYRCMAPPLAMYHCHCRSCQQLGNDGYSSILVAPAKALAIEGEPRYCLLQGIESDHPRHGFCGECGSALFASNEFNPAVVIVRASSLDDASWFKPVADIWTAECRPWSRMDSHIPKVYKAPPILEAGGAVRV